jgi:hypothetical protein
MQMGNSLLRGSSVVLFSVLATILTFLQGMKRTVSVSSPRGMNIGKVQTILPTFGLSSLKVGFSFPLRTHSEHTLTYENNPLGREEMADTDESLDVDDKGYPLLPDDVLGLRLRRKKAIMRQFMSAVRRTCC